MTDHVETHWPQLAALISTLNDLDQRQGSVAQPAGKAEDVLLERLVAKLNRTGGPKISSRAIV